MATPLELVKAVLEKFNPGADELTLERLRDDIEIAEDLSTEPIKPRLKTREARTLFKATVSVLDIAQAHSLATTGEIKSLHRIKRAALVAIRTPPKSGPDSAVRDWIGPCCVNFLDSYPSPANKGHGVWRWDVSSEALEFLFECCRLVATGITENAILKAMQEHHQDRSSEEERDEAYAQWFADLEKFEQELLKPIV